MCKRGNHIIIKDAQLDRQLAAWGLLDIVLVYGGTYITNLVLVSIGSGGRKAGLCSVRAGSRVQFLVTIALVLLFALAKGLRRIIVRPLRIYSFMDVERDHICTMLAISWPMSRLIPDLSPHL